MRTVKKWIDHIVRKSGKYTVASTSDPQIYKIAPTGDEVIQEGTPLAASGFNNIEHSLTSQELASLLLANFERQKMITSGSITVDQKNPRRIDSEGKYASAELALQTACGSKNKLIYDDRGIPSVMVRIPKCTWADLGFDDYDVSDPTATFPAFVVNGEEIDEIWVSKYMNCTQDGRAYSWPAQNYTDSLIFADAASACSAKGAGWNVQSRLSKMVVTLLSDLLQNDGPRGNNDYGKDKRENDYIAIPASSSEIATQTVLGGTGPLTWSHDGTVSGVWDTNGNGWEYVGGVRLYYGELQVISHDGVSFGNDAVDPDNDQSPQSTLWRAIDGATGNLVVPDGNGTTPGTVKSSWLDNSWKWVVDNSRVVKSSGAPVWSAYVSFEGLGGSAYEKLLALGLIPIDAGYDGQMCFDNTGDYVLVCSCPHNLSVNPQTHRNILTRPRLWGIGFQGFRADYVEIPEEEV